MQLPEEVDIAEEMEAPPDEADFWFKVSRPAIDAVWDNEEDDVYAELLA